MEESRGMAIKHWSERDRPRERLRLQGRSALTDAELLAILLGSGSRQESALDLARRILAANRDSLESLGRNPVTKLQQFNGVGPVKAVKIVAALELGRRMRTNNTRQHLKISCSRDAHETLYPVLSDLPHEEFWVLYLNNNNRVIHQARLSQGGINGTLVDVRLVLKQALELGAVALILAHNHPSGNLKPSGSDKALTEKIKTAADTIDVKVLDHIILGGKNYYSFADQNDL